MEVAIVAAPAFEAEVDPATVVICHLPHHRRLSQPEHNRD
jgi:hypothetical protein